MKFLILFFIISGCGTFQLKNGIYSQTDFIEYTHYYLKDKQKYLGDKNINYEIQMSFNELKNTVVGNCKTKRFYIPIPSGTNYTRKFIEIDIDFWTKAKDCEKKLVIYHELGHCDLDLEHNENKMSIMYKNTNYIKYNFCQNDEKYIEEFFNSTN